MVDVHYGVIQQDGVWSIIGDSLHFGSYPTRRIAERAARRLARQSGGLSVLLHVQTELGELLPPVEVD